jgi:prepilin-type N-terminal cleavage/methylation domain-containing protein
VTRQPPQSGFSLVEVLVAIGVLTVGVAAVAQLTLVSRSSAVAAAVTTTATILAQDKLEQLHGAGWSAVPAADCCDFFDGAGQPLASGAQSPPGALYRRQWSIDELPMAPASARVVRVVVEPLSGAGAVRLVAVRYKRSD